MIFEAQLSRLSERWERLSPRERTLVSAMAATFIVMITLILGFVVTDSISTVEGQNADARQALRDLDTQREPYLRAKAKANAMELRMGKTPVQLQAFLEQVAKDSGVEIPESNELAPVPAGKQFVERSVSIRLKQVKLDSLAKFLKGVEGGPNLVVVTALRVTTRDEKHENLEVEMTVTTYDHVSDKAKSGKKGDKT
ncbi:MAG: type II secretion system protein GspM [Polyangia bacterium]